LSFILLSYRRLFSDAKMHRAVLHAIARLSYYRCHSSYQQSIFRVAFRRISLQRNYNQLSHVWNHTDAWH